MSNETIEGVIYLQALVSYIKAHELRLAGNEIKSWSSLLGFGSTSITEKRSFQLLELDVHHLYYLLLKFDELISIPKIGPLDIQLEGGSIIPMTTQDFTKDVSDSMSIRSTISSFSIGSNWWSSTSTLPIDESSNVKYLYSACTKIPSISFSPFHFKQQQKLNLQKPIFNFLDCPPDGIAIPLYAFKNLQSLSLQDLDFRGFIGWDLLNYNLKSLIVIRSGMEDLGELLCDTIVEDLALKNGGKGIVGQKRRQRANHQIEIPNDSSEEDFYPKLPNHSWSSLIHLSIASNSLTFIPSPPLAYLTSLTSLDLSSNLLISIPTGLSQLVSLKSLTVCDNMIDSLAGIAIALPNIESLNLSNNRIENLSGLDKLLRLKRLDLRNNLILESLEISRLAILPSLKQLWIKGNPFSREEGLGGEMNYRVKCFNYFELEGNSNLQLDGTNPGFNEKRFIITKPINYSNSIGRVQSSKLSLGKNSALGKELEFSSTESGGGKITTTVENITKAKKKKSKRIVDLDDPKPNSDNKDRVQSGDSSSESGPIQSTTTNKIDSIRFNKPTTTRRHSSITTQTFLPPSLSPPFELQDTFSPTATTNILSNLNVSSGNGGNGGTTEEYRKRMESLRDEVGSNWLTVLNSEREQKELKLSKPINTNKVVEDQGEGNGVEDLMEAGPVVVKVLSKRKKKGTI